MTTDHDSRRAMREGARKGARKVARERRRRRWVAVYRAWSRTGQPMTVAELAEATDRTPSVIRAALKDPEHGHKVEKTTEGGVARYYFNGS